MKVVVYAMPDGTVWVMRPVEPPREGESEADYLARIKARAVPANATGTFECDETEIPQNRTFRAAWRLDGRKIAVDMPIARAIKMDRIRAERNRRLEATDKDVAKLDGAPLSVELRGNRQALREVPQKAGPALEAIESAAALEAFEPDWP